MINFDTPKFITFEGGEGSGKSTQSRKLYEYLSANDVKVTHTREIGGTDLAEKIRDIVVHSEMMNISELLIIMAARYDHIIKVIIPALLDGISVICDRFVDSTVCYQFDESEISMDYVCDLHKDLMIKQVQKYFEEHTSMNDEKQGLLDSIIKKQVMPDVTFLMDLHPKVALERAIIRGQANKFEAKSFQYHERLYSAFKEQANKYSNRFKVIDCSDKDVSEIHQDIISHIDL